jgi:hypothetical protein
MKFIKHSDNAVGIELVAKEIVNLEMNKLIFVDGERNRGKITVYPSFNVDGVTTIIKPNFVVVILPDEMNMSVEVVRIKNKVEELYILISDQFPEAERAKAYHALETGSLGFTTTKTKHSLTNTLYNEKQNSDADRRIVENSSCTPISKIVGARITWIFYTMNQILCDIQSHKRAIHLSSQLVTIFYDNGNTTIFSNFHLLLDNFLLVDFTFLKNMIDLTSIGKMDKTFFRALPDGKIKSYFLQHCQKYFKMPEFHSSWVKGPHTILICEKRKAGFEIMKHLGNFSIYEEMCCSDTAYIQEITQPLWRVKYYEIQIYNDEIDSNRCVKCLTPLYDDVYGVFSNTKTKMCRSYCAICMHTKFNCSLMNLSGERVYKETDTIARFKYPKSAKEIIDTIPVDNDVKNIYKLSFGKTPQDYILNKKKEDKNKALYLGFRGGLEYFGWDGSFEEFYEYHKEIAPGTTWGNHLKHAKIFYFKSISG